MRGGNNSFTALCRALLIFPVAQGTGIKCLTRFKQTESVIQSLLCPHVQAVIRNDFSLRVIELTGGEIEIGRADAAVQIIQHTFGRKVEHLAGCQQSLRVIEPVFRIKDHRPTANDFPFII